MHIKGHQDDRTTYDELDIVSQANVDVNLLAKQELSINRPVDNSLILPGQCWRLRNLVNNELIQGNIESSLRTALYKEWMKRYWTKKFQIGQDVTTDEWSLMCKVNSSHTENEHLFMVKHASGILATKKNMVHRKHEDDARCPCCELIEDTDHILQCQAPTQVNTFFDELDDLDMYLTNITS